jgi:replication-associated recombination protein RarA
MVFEKFFRNINMTKEIFSIDFEDKILQREGRLFSDIRLYDDLKLLLFRMLVSKDSVHCVLVGPPASGKTMFLLSIQKNMKDVFFIDATNASGAGIIDKLVAYPRTGIVLIDEIEKMSKRDQNMLLNLLETGMLVSTKVRKTQEMKFTGIKLFATSNDIEQLSEPLRSRLMELHLPEYDFDEFREIVGKLAANRYRMNREIADRIASIVWYEIGTKDVRDALQFMKLVRSVDDVEKTARTIMKYNPKILNPSVSVESVRRQTGFSLRKLSQKI